MHVGPTSVAVDSWSNVRRTQPACHNRQKQRAVTLENVLLEVKAGEMIIPRTHALTERLIDRFIDRSIN